MRKLVLLPFLALGISCSDGALLQPETALQPGQDAPGIAAAQGATKMVPFKGHGEWEELGSELGCEGNPDYLRAWGVGVSNVTHLGRSEYSFVNCWDPSTFDFVSQTGMVTAANGDQLFWYASADLGTVVSIPTPTSYAMGPMWFTGGTGRFDGATGQFSASGALAPDWLTGTENWDGMVSSIGSLK